MYKITSVIICIIAVSVLAMAPFSEKEELHDHHDIVDIAADTDALSTLVAAVDAAGLVETLKSDGPFTVFAPTNEAFAALPEGTVESLLMEENRELLIEILTYHVIAGEVMSSDLSDGMTAETVNGDEVTISISNSGVMVDNASVVEADIEASNGVIHVIDAVIMPSDDSSGY